ncbi:MAG TPA: segregation/condensation protein A [Leucothrix mucor]|nr:segregation/condensation protein A [Leucothrix mucor]
MSSDEQSNAQTLPRQGELPFAIVQGEPLSAPPEDLYIPPDALEVFLDTFEGPLDLLLYLIRRQNLDILNIPIAEITRQYMDYVELMRSVNLDLAAEYLVMAAMLAEIKSRMLLPRHEDVEDEDDPRAELIRRLQEYERFKQAAEDIAELPRQEREYFLTEVEPIREEKQKVYPELDLKDIVFAFQDILKRVDLKTHHQIKRESLSVRERMSNVLARLEGDDFVDFHSLFTLKEGRLGVVVTFLAILELLKSQVIDMVQAQAYAPIYIKTASSEVV